MKSVFKTKIIFVQNFECQGRFIENFVKYNGKTNRKSSKIDAGSRWFIKHCQETQKN